MTISPAAAARLDSLADGQALHLSLVPNGELFLPSVTEAPAEQPPCPLHPRVIANPVDLERLRGLQLDHHEHRWRITLSLTIRAVQTPNPNSRLYRTDFPLHRGHPVFATSAEEAHPLVRRILRIDGVQSVLFRDHTLTINRREQEEWSLLDREVDAGLRQALLMGAGTIQGIQAPESNEPLIREVQQFLHDHVLPGIHRDGGDLELLTIEGGVVYVAMRGACQSCPASALTLKSGVQKKLIAAFPDQVVEVKSQ